MTVGKMMSTVNGKFDKYSNAIRLLANNYGSGLTVSCSRKPMDIIRTLMNLQDYNMVLVGNMKAKDMTTDMVELWKDIITMTAQAETETSGKKMKKKVATIEKIKITPSGILIKWNKLTAFHMKYMEEQFNSYDSWGDLLLMCVISPEFHEE